VADIDDRWFRREPGKPQKVPTARHGKGKRWDVRWRDDAGRQRHKAFERKQEAESFLAQIQADLARGIYTDPAAGKVTVRTYAKSWLAAQTFDPSTREATELRLRLHIFPELGGRELRALRPSVVQAWTRSLQQRPASNYVRVVFANLSAVLSAAVDDGLIGRNPCRAGSVRPPAPERRRIVPWSAERVAAVTAALPERYQVLVMLAAGCGLRQGEAFGLSPDDVDFLRGVVHVRRQVKLVHARQVFGAPKGGKERDVPLPEMVALALAAHLQAFPAVKVTLPWREPDGRTETAGLGRVSRIASGPVGSGP
jgi:integrase